MPPSEVTPMETRELFKKIAADSLPGKVFQFFIPIVPQAKQSVRFGLKRAYTCPKKRAYAAALKEALAKFSLQRSQVIKGLVKVRIAFAFPPTVGLKKKLVKRDAWRAHSGKPDADNLQKPVLDALQGTVIETDAAIFDLHVVKIRYRTPGIFLEITQMTFWYEVAE